MPVCLRSQPSCHASLKFAGYSNLLNADMLKMSNLKLPARRGNLEHLNDESLTVEPGFRISWYCWNVRPQESQSIELCRKSHRNKNYSPFSIFNSF